MLLNIFFVLETVIEPLIRSRHKLSTKGKQILAFSAEESFELLS
jgi:hypothetical protein